jgi:putative oxidoreductase
MNETTTQYSKGKNVTLLVIRIITGALFVAVGGMKAYGIDMTIGLFTSLHLPVLFAYLVSYGEIGFGILLLLGLWARLATTVLTIIILGAIYFTLPMGFPTLLMPIITLVLLVVLLKCGAGKYRIKSSHFN